MNKKKEEEKKMAIWNAVLTEHSIECNKCSKVKKEFNVDEFNFVDNLIEKGWDYKRGMVICDECNNK